MSIYDYLEDFGELDTDMCVCDDTNIDANSSPEDDNDSCYDYMFGISDGEDDGYDELRF